MYSRFSHRKDPSVKIPDHYSGCAFSPTSPDEPTRFLEVAKPTPQEHATRYAEPPLPLPDEDVCREETPTPPPLPTVHPRHFLTDELDFDQLLILGLILLLWGNERDGDVVLWLGLLLLWG